MGRFLKFVLSFVVISAAHNSNAQGSIELDSLLQKLDNLIFENPILAKPYIDSLNAQAALLEHKEYQHSLGNYYYLSGRYDSAFEAYNRALNLALADGDSSRILSLNNNIGVSLIELGRISESVAYLRETLERRKAIRDTGRILTSFGNLIEAYQVLEASDKISDLLEESFAYEVDSIEYAGPLRRIHLLAYFHFYKAQNYSKALEHLQGMKRMNVYINDQRSLGEYHLGMGRILLATGAGVKAEGHLLEAINQFKETHFEGGLTAAYLEMAQLKEQSDTKAAIKYYEAALETVTAPDMEMSIYAGLYQLHKGEGNYQLALEAQEEMRILKDSLLGAEVQKAVFEIESKYQLREKESEIKRLNNEATIAALEAEQAELKAKRFRNYLWVGVIVMLITIALFILQMRNQALKRMQESLKRDLDEQALKIDKQNLQIQLFRSQINPHFFFNTLNSIQSFVLNNEALDSSRYLGKFARLMRATLELNNQEFISLEQEVAILKDYLSLEELRFEDKFKWEINLPEELRNHQVPTMILQPFVENAIVHGFKDFESGGKLQLNFTPRNDHIEIQVLDNGKGYNPSPGPKQGGKSSIALSLIEKRLKLLSQEQNANYEFEISNRVDSQGTLVLIKIPKA